MLFVSVFSQSFHSCTLAQPITVDTHHFSNCARAKKMSAPFFGCNALWLNSNPRASVLEIVIPFRDHLDESGAVRSSCSDNNAAQIRPWKRSSPTQRRSAMYEEPARDFMERLAQLEEERKNKKGNHSETERKISDPHGTHNAGQTQSVHKRTQRLELVVYLRSIQ